jgi:hypothetical protein
VHDVAFHRDYRGLMLIDDDSAAGHQTAGLVAREIRTTRDDAW